MSASFPLDWPIALIAAPFVGSFLGVLARRLPAGEGVVLGRSACPHCGHALGPRDLVPILSWALAGGRCRHCGARLGIFYPAVELMALAVAAWAAAVMDGWLVWASCALGWALLALALIDWRHLLLPDSLTLPLIPAGLAVAYALEPAALADHAIGGVAGFAALFAVAAAYRQLRGHEGLGLGDAKLLAAAGAWVSWTGLPSVMVIAGATGLALALVSVLRGRPPGWTRAVPYGTYLALATWIVWLHGPLVPG